ncbi:pitrilysin family protein, partial [uncultured Aureimonas sp.]|uniref:M16 family metallopeptidase n=1 Tax=uncultured Aureimonas sp. TaxID=1604662 RepID=UPI0025FB80CA
MSVEITRLSNGLTIATETMPTLESAALGVWVKAGARDEAEGEHGIAHLLEHMAFKGTSRRSARQIAEEIEDVGGELNASTSVETTAYYARVMKDDVPLAVDILTDILLDSRFDEDELAREQHVILQEIGAAEDTPDDIVFDHFQSAAYADQILGRPILGTRESVSGFTPAEIRAYLKRHYSPDQMVVSAAGAVSHDDVVRRVEAAFGSSASSAEGTHRREPAVYTGGDFREERDLADAQMVLGFPGRPYYQRDFYAAQVLSIILGGGMSSRLFQEIRETRGLCYAISAFHWSFSDTGIFGVHAATGEEEMAELAPV